MFLLQVFKIAFYIHSLHEMYAVNMNILYERKQQ